MTLFHFSDIIDCVIPNDNTQNQTHTEKGRNVMKRTKLLGMISFIMFIAIAICALFSGCKPMNDKDAIAEPTEAPTVKPKPVANTPELTPTQEPTQAPTPEPTPCPTSEPVTEVPTPEPSYDANDIVLFFNI